MKRYLIETESQGLTIRGDVTRRDGPAGDSGTLLAGEQSYKQLVPSGKGGAFGQGNHWHIFALEVINGEVPSVR